MVQKPNIVVMYGGGGHEHEVSELSVKYILHNLEETKLYNVSTLLMNRDGKFLNKNAEEVFIRPDQKLITLKKNDHEGIHVDYIIPCFHGFPGETGNIQSYLNLLKIPYLGCDTEASVLAFNKISTKLWLDKNNIPTTRYIFLNNGGKENKKHSHNFFKECKNDIFVKASSEGSAVGIYHITDESHLDTMIKKAFEYGDQVLLEETLIGRELEISAFEYKNELIITDPGEILCADGFYSYEEKYSDNSNTQTQIKAINLSNVLIETMKQYALEAYKLLDLKDLSRIDFFLTKNQEIYLNEINTFPGMTPISMFPKMMQEHGVNFRDYLIDRIESAIKKD